MLPNALTLTKVNLAGLAAELDELGGVRLQPELPRDSANPLIQQKTLSRNADCNLGCIP